MRCPQPLGLHDGSLAQRHEAAKGNGVEVPEGRKKLARHNVPGKPSKMKSVPTGRWINWRFPHVPSGLETSLCDRPAILWLANFRCRFATKARTRGAGNVENR
jgi:hypothetical protein